MIIKIKTSLALVFFVIITITGTAQDKKDVIYLKNGSVVKGTITEQIPNEQLKIMTSDGNLFVFKYSEIEKMTKETQEVNVEEYGGEYSYGVAIGGGGIVGIPVRYYIQPNIAIEGSVHYRGVYNFDYETFSNSVMIAAGPILYLDKSYNSFKQKVISNGVTFKAGYSFSDYNEGMLALAWARESFKKQNKKNSFVFELGAGVFKHLGGDYTIYYSNGSEYQPMIYWKLHWCWYGN